MKKKIYSAIFLFFLAPFIFFINTASAADPVCQHEGQILRRLTGEAFYLVENCRVRMVPDRSTMVHMGYDPDRAITVNDEEFNTFEFGPAYPRYGVGAGKITDLRLSGRSPGEFILEWDSEFSDQMSVTYSRSSGGISGILYGTNQSETRAFTRHRMLVSNPNWTAGSQLFYQLTDSANNRTPVYEYFVPGAADRLLATNLSVTTKADSAMIAWQTDKPARSEVYVLPAFGSDPAWSRRLDEYWASSTAKYLFSDNYNNYHNFTVSGLQPGTRYNFAYVSFDVQKYLATNSQSPAAFFTTLAAATSVSEIFAPVSPALPGQPLPQSGWLIKNRNNAEVFYVDLLMNLRWIINEVAADKYFGPAWNTTIHEYPDLDFSGFRFGETMK